MRFAVFVRATRESEAGQMPDEKLLTEMGNFNTELQKAGIMLAGEGLKPTVHAKRMKFGGAKPTVIDGPFTESKELIAGFWLLQAGSMDEVVAWMNRAPCHEGFEIEIRPLFEPTDFDYAPGVPEREIERPMQLEQAKQR